MSTHIEPRPGADAATAFAAAAAMLVVVGMIIGFLLAGWGLSSNVPTLPTPNPAPLPTFSSQPEAGR